MFKFKLVIILLIVSSFTVGIGYPTTAEVMTDQESDTSITLESQTPQAPEPGQDIQLDFGITDPDGVSSVNIDYTYDYDGSSGSSVLSESDNYLVENQSVTYTSTFENGDYVTGNYTYIANGITYTYFELVVKNSNYELRFVELLGLNPSTSEWVSIIQEGTLDGTDTLTTPYTVNEGGFHYAGIQLITQSFKTGGGQPDSIIINDASIQGPAGYSATIPSSPQATLIDYTVTVEDSNGDIGNFDDTIIVNTPAETPVFNENVDGVIFGGSLSLPVNVTITDVDGIDTISNVRAMYKLTSETNYKFLTLSKSKEISDTEAIYYGSLDESDFKQVEESIDIRVNVTDSVSGIIAGSTSTNIINPILDNHGPTIDSITYDVISQIGNSSEIDHPLNFTVVAGDINGISGGLIEYNFGDGTTRDNLVNSTFLLATETTEEFSYSIGAPNESVSVTYSFIFTDFFGNEYQTDDLIWYFDGDAPIPTDISSSNPYPRVNETSNIYYNVWDPAGLTTQRFYYKIGTSGNWTEGTPGTVTNADTIKNTTTFTAYNLPVSNDTASVNEATIYTNTTHMVDDATLTLELSHASPTELLVELLLPNGTIYVISNRTSQTTFSLDLIAINITSFSDHNYTIRVTDFVDNNQDVSIDVLEIELILYSAALGREYKFEGLTSSTELYVYYKFEFEDGHGNLGNSTEYSLYFDNSPPSLDSFSRFKDGLNVNGSDYITFDVKASDPSGIDKVVVEYHFASDKLVQKLELTQITSTLFSRNLTLINTEDGITYTITVYDNAGFNTTSSEISFTYIGANAPSIEIIPMDEPVDMQGSGTLIIQASIMDNDEISTVTLHYGFSEDDIDESVSMSSVDGTDIYNGSVEVNAINGSVYFYITAVDINDLSTTSDTYEVDYINATLTEDTSDKSGSIAGTVALVVLGVGVVGGIGYAIYYFKDKIMEAFGDLVYKIKNMR